ncbi:MAG: hypothetical protein PHD05_05010 [Sphaerochaetaceae bacterium]|nr:hypothetical protein [Sphaerochaetaceae bacterium]
MTVIINSKILEKCAKLDNSVHIEDPKIFKQYFKEVLNTFIEEMGLIEIDNLMYGDLENFYTLYIVALNNISNKLNSDLKKIDLYESAFLGFKSEISAALRSQKGSDTISVVRAYPNQLLQNAKAILKNI